MSLSARHQRLVGHEGKEEQGDTSLGHLLSSVSDSTVQHSPEISSTQGECHLYQVLEYIVCAVEQCPHLKNSSFTCLTCLHCFTHIPSNKVIDCHSNIAEIPEDSDSVCSNDEEEDGGRHDLDMEGECGSLIQSACGKTRR